MTEYEASLKKYRDLKGVIDTAFEEGEKIGLDKGEKIGLDKGEKIGLEKGEIIGLEKGEKIGFDKGEKVGIDKMARQMAIAMKNEGISIEKIANYTGLSQEDVNKL